MACPGGGKVSFLHFDGSVSFVAGFRKLQGVTGKGRSADVMSACVRWSFASSTRARDSRFEAVVCPLPLWQRGRSLRLPQRVPHFTASHEGAQFVRSLLRFVKGLMQVSDGIPSLAGFQW